MPKSLRGVKQFWGAEWRLFCFYTWYLSMNTTNFDRIIIYLLKNLLNGVMPFFGTQQTLIESLFHVFPSSICKLRRGADLMSFLLSNSSLRFLQCVNLLVGSNHEVELQIESEKLKDGQAQMLIIIIKREKKKKCNTRHHKNGPRDML